MKSLTRLAVLCISALYSIPLSAQILSSVPAAVNDTIALCAGADDTVSFSISGSPSQTFSWDFGNGVPATASGGGPHSVQFSNAGISTVNVYVSDSGSVTDTLAVQVNSGQPLPVNWIPSQTSFCSSDAPFTFDGMSPSGGYFSGPGVNGNQFDPGAAGAGNHNIWYYYGQGSCLDSAMVTFSVTATQATPNLYAQGSPITFNGVNTYTRCVPASSIFNFYTTTSSSQYTSYTIDFGDGQSQTGTAFPSPFLSHAYANTGIFDVVLSITNGNGCVAHDTIRVFYGSNPSVGLSIKGNNIKCLPKDSSGITFAFPISNTSSNPPGTVYIVEVNDGSAPAIYNHPPPDSILHTFYEPSCGYNTVNFQNAFQVKITAKTPCQPNSVATVEPIFISDPPTAAFNVEPRVCIGNPTSIQDASWGSINALTGCDTNVTLVWEIFPKNYVVNSGYEGHLMGSNNPMNWLPGSNNLNVTFTKTGYYTINQYVGNQAGCEIDTVTQVVCVDSIAAPDFALDKDSICSPDSVHAWYLNDLVSFCDTTDLQWTITPAGGWTMSGAQDSSMSAYFYRSGIYTIGITSSNHCDTSVAVKTIKVQGPPDMIMPKNRQFCGLRDIDFSVTGYTPTRYDSLAALSYNWQVIPASGWNFASGSSASSENPVIEFSNYGTYQVVHSISNHCGSFTDTVAYTFYENPEIVAIPDTVLCYGSNYSQKILGRLGAQPLNFRWRVIGQGGWNNNSDSIFLSNLTTSTQIWMQVEDSLGCSNDDTLAINIPSKLNADAGNDQWLCYTDTAYLNGQATGGTAPYTFQWIPATGLSNSTSANPYRLPSDSSQIYQLVVTDSLGCSDTDEVAINIYPIVNVDAGPDMAVCYDPRLTTLNSHSPKGGSWSGPGLTDSIFDPIAAGLGIHTLFYDFTDANGCEYQDSLTINVINIPEARFSHSGNGCGPLNVSMYDSSSAGVTHKWYINDSLASTTANPTFLLTNSSTTQDSIYQIKLVIEAGTGCTDSTTGSVTVYPGPKAGFSLVSQVCPNDSVKPSQNSKLNARIKWWTNSSFISISNDTLREPFFIFGDNQSGLDTTVTVFMRATTPNGCSDTVSRSITINSRPLADFDLPPAACSPTTIFPVDQSSGQGLSYQWSISPKVTISKAGKYDPSIQLPLSTNDSVVYTISLQVTDSRGCIDTISKTYTVYPQPTAAFTPDTLAGCSPLVLNFNNQSSSNLPGQHLRDLDLHWDFGNGLISSDSLPSSTFINNGLSDTSYTVWLRVSNEFGCSDSVSQTITVHPHSRAVIDTFNLSACAPFVIDDNAAAAQLFPSANQEYIWQFVDGNGNILDTDSGATNLSYVLNQPADTVFGRLITSSLFGCDNDTDVVTFFTLPDPVAAFSATPAQACSPLQVQLNDSSIAANQYKWYVNGVLTSAVANPAFTFVNNSHIRDSLVVVTLEVSSANGCTDSISDTITINPQPSAAFSLPADVCPGDTAFSVNNSEFITGSSFRWKVNSPAVSISNDTARAPYFSFMDNQSGTDSIYQVTLIVNSPEGCVDSVSQNIRLNSRPVADFSMPAAACSPITLNPFDNSSGTNLSYQWRVSPAVSIQGASHHTPTFDFPVSLNDSVVYTIDLLVTDSRGCSDSTSQTYTVYPKPTAAFSASIPDTCGPVTVSFDNLSLSGQSGMDRSTMSFAWDFGNGQTSTDSVPSLTLTNTGNYDSTYVITLVATNAFGCSDTVLDTITIHPSPKAVISFTNSANCAPFVLDSNVVNAQVLALNNQTYYWEVIDVNGTIVAQDSGVSKVNYTISQPSDSVWVRLTASSPYGCETDTSLQLFYTIENPVADFELLPANGCSPMAVSVADSSTPGAAQKWFVNDSLWHQGTNPVFSFSNSSHTQDSVISVKLLLTAGTGCTDSLTKTLRLFPAPDARFSLPAEICPGEVITVNDSSLAKFGYSTEWSVNSSAVSIQNALTSTATLSFPDNQSGTDSSYTVKLKITSVDGCVDSIQRTVILKARPLADFSMPAAACAPVINNPINASSGNNLSYQWSVSPAINIQGAQRATPTFSFPASFNDSVVYRVKLTLTDSISGCVDTLEQNYTIYPRPTADFSANTNHTCGPLTVSFHNLSSPNQWGMDRSSMNFSWDFGNGQSSSDSVPTVTFTNTGTTDSTYLVRLIASNAFGCSDTAFDTIVVHPSPRSSFSATSNAGCAPFVIDSSVVNTTVLNYANANYYWEVLDLNGTIIAQDTSVNGLSHTLSQPGDSIYIRLTATSAFGCAADTSMQLFYTIENPVADFTPLPANGCSPLTVTVADSASAGAQRLWYLNDSLYHSGMNPVFNLVNLSNDRDSVVTLKLVVTAGTGCSDSSSQQVVIHPTPKADFSLAGNVCPNVSLYPTDSSIAKGNYGFKWYVNSPRVSISNDTLASPGFHFPDNQSGYDSTYTVSLVITTADGCSDSIAKPVTIFARPLADFNMPANACAPLQLGPIDASRGHNLQYQWQVWPAITGQGMNSAAPTFDFPVSTNDSVVYDIRLFVTDSVTGCTDTLNKNFTVYPKPTAAFTPSRKDSCGPFTVSFSNQSLSNQSGMDRSTMSFSWDFGNGQFSNDSTPVVIFTNGGLTDTTYRVEMIATNAFGCSDTLVDFITVHPDPKVDFTAAPLFDCAPFTIDTSIVKYTHYVGANSAYQFQFLDYKTDSVLANFNRYDSLSYLLPLPGDSVKFRMIAQSPFGCKADTATTLFYSLGQEPIGFSASATEGCSPLVVSLADTGNGFSAWEWYVDGKLVSQLKNPVLSFTNSSTTQDSIYTVKMIAQAGNGCPDSIIQQIRVYAELDPQFTISNACLGDSLQFNNLTPMVDSVATWYWDFGDGNTDSSFAPQHQYASSGQYVVSLTATSIHGCSFTVSDTATQYPLPVASFGVDNSCGRDSACAGQSITFFDSSTVASLGGQIVQWQWDILNDGSIDYTSNQPSHTFAQPGNYDVRLIVTSNFGCSDTIVRDIEIYEPPMAHFVLDSVRQCGPFTTSVSDSSTGLIESYQWEVFGLTPGGQRVVMHSSTQQNPNPLPTFKPNWGADTTYYIELTVGNCCGSTTYLDSLTLKSMPVPKAIPSASQGCTPLDVSFQLDGQVKGQPDYVVFDYGDGSPLDTIHRFYQIRPNGDTIYVWGQNSHRFVNNGLQDTTFRVAVTAVNDCGDSTVYTNILVHPNNVQAFIDATPDRGCAPLSVTVVDRSFGGTNTSWCLDYDTANGSCNLPTAVGDSIVHTYTTAGTYVIAQFVNDGCSADTAFKTITVYPSPQAIFTHSGDICEDESVWFFNSSIADTITGYVWNFGDGNGSILKDPIHTYNTPGTYPVSLNITSANGCTSVLWDTVNVFDKPDMAFSASNACFNEQPIAFFDSSSVQNGQMLSTLWKFGDGNTSVSANPVHRYAQPGSYTVTLIHSSTNGCTDSVSQVVQVLPIAEAKFTERNASGKTCGAPQMFSFTNQSQGAAGYYWDFDYNGQRGRHTSTLNNPSFLYQTEGVYDVMLVATNAFGCADTAFKTLYVRPVPEAGFTADVTEGCAPLTVNFSDSTVYDFSGPGGIVKWTWDFGDGNYAYDSANVTHTYNEPGVYTVKLYVETDAGCGDSIVYNKYIKVLPTPIPFFTETKENAKTFKFNNLTKNVSMGTTYLWDFGDGSTSTEFSPTHTYNVDLFKNDYEFTVCLITMNEFGCGDTICRDIDLKGYLLFTPNAFAPDLSGAGEARYFLPKGHSLQEYHLKIFDEWGNIIFESTSLDESGMPDEPWDGTHIRNGTPLPMGAYVWQIDALMDDGTIWPGLDDGRIKKRTYGTVTLLR